MGMLKGLSGVFLPRQVISFSMVSGGTMSLGGKLVVLSSFPVQILHKPAYNGKGVILAATAGPPES